MQIGPWVQTHVMLFTRLSKWAELCGPWWGVNRLLIACIWPIDVLLYNRPVKRRHFVLDFAGNRFNERNINHQLILALQWWNPIVFSLNHTEQKWLRWKRKIKSYYRWLTCHEQFQKSSRIGVLNDRNLDPFICTVQSNRLVSKQLCNGCVVAVCSRKQGNVFGVTFYYESFVFPSNSSVSFLLTGKQTSGKEVEWN